MPEKNNHKPRLLKGFLRVFLVLILSLSAAVMLVRMRPQAGRQTTENPPLLVEAVVARKISQNMIIQAYGTMRSGEILNLISEVRGQIVEMAPSFEEGNYFPRGSFLIRIDPRSYTLTIERLQTEIHRLDAELARIEQEKINLQASLKITSEDLELAEAEYDRNVSLSQRNLVSQNQMDQTRQKWLVSRRNEQELQNSLALIKPRLDALKAQRHSVETQLKEARLDLERTEISAPFNARVGEKLVEAGQYVMAGNRLASIYNVDIMEVEIHVPPQDLVWLPFNSLDSGKSNSPSLNTPVRARISYSASGKKVLWEGYVSRIKGQMEETTRTLPVIIQVQDGHPGRAYPLLPGMFVSVEIIGKEAEDLFLLPREAVREDSTVFVVEDGRVSARATHVYRRMDNQVYVNKGLSDGDQVIVRFPGVASQGMKVRVNLKTDQQD